MSERKLGFLPFAQYMSLVANGATDDEIAAVARANAEADPLRNLLGRPPYHDDPEFDSNAILQ